MWTKASYWRSCAIAAALVLLASVYGVSLQSSRALDCNTDDESSAVLQAKLASLTAQRARLEEALQRCDLEGSRPGAEPTAASSARGITPVSTAAIAPRDLSLAPEHRRSILLQRYGQLLRELSLSPEQSDALLGALATLDPSAGLLPSEPPDAAREQAVIAHVVGPDKAAEFQRLKLTLPARAELRAVRDRLEQAGDDLSPEQLEELTAVLTARTAQLALPPKAGADETAEQRMLRLRSWMHDRERGFREDEAGVLSQSQLQLLDAGRVPLRTSSRQAASGLAGSPG
jgi:hypothetical protein